MISQSTSSGPRVESGYLDWDLRNRKCYHSCHGRFTMLLWCNMFHSSHLRTRWPSFASWPDSRWIWVLVIDLLWTRSKSFLIRTVESIRTSVTLGWEPGSLSPAFPSKKKISIPTNATDFHHTFSPVFCWSIVSNFILRLNRVSLSLTALACRIAPRMLLFFPSVLQNWAGVQIDKTCSWTLTCDPHCAWHWGHKANKILSLTSGRF